MQFDQDKLIAEKSKHEAWLTQQEGITGVGVGLDRGGQICIKVFTNRATPSTIEGIRSRLGNVPVDFEEAGEFRAF